MSANPLWHVSDLKFWIPQSITDSSTACHRRAGEARAAARVLMVDDNVDSAEAFALLVGLEGYQVSVAHDGLRAVELAQRLQPAIIFMDIEMPRLMGGRSL